MDDTQGTVTSESPHEFGAIDPPQYGALRTGQFIVVVRHHLSADPDATKCRAGRVLERVNQPLAGVQATFARNDFASMMKRFSIWGNRSAITQGVAAKVPS